RRDVLLGQLCHRRLALARYAQGHYDAVDLTEIVVQRLARAAQQVLERCDIRNALRQAFAHQQHVSSPSYCSRMSRTTNIRSRPSTSPYSATPSKVRSTTAITIAGVSSEDCTWIMR